MPLKTTERKPGGAPTMRIGGLRIRPTRRGWTFVALAALLLASYTADAVVTIGRVRSGVQAGSLKLGGNTRDGAKKLLNERAQLLISQPVELFADNHRITVSPSEIGFRPDVDATLDAAAEVGRTGNFIVRLWHRVRSLFASTDVGWGSTHDTKAAKLLVSDFASRVDTQGHEAGIEPRARRSSSPVGAVPGRRLDRAAIETVIAGLESWPPTIDGAADRDPQPAHDDRRRSCGCATANGGPAHRSRSARRTAQGKTLLPGRARHVDRCRPVRARSTGP